MYYSYSRKPTGQELFVPARTLIEGKAVKKRGVQLMIRLILLVAVTEDDGVGLWELQYFPPERDGLIWDALSRSREQSKRDQAGNKASRQTTID